MKSYCNKCNGSTNQTVMKEEKTSYEDGEGWWEEIDYQIIQCSGCDEITFRRLETNVQIQSYDDIPHYMQELYPKRGPNSIVIKNFSNLSIKLKSLYRETIDAFNNEQLILCCGGLRALIEGICLDKTIKGVMVKGKKNIDVLKGNLEGKIEGLFESGFLTKSSANSLHELRFIGNEALHELSKPSIYEIKLAIEILESTIDNMYELHHKAMKIQMKNRLEKNKRLITAANQNCRFSVA